jgi:hypothetical protein
MAGAGTDRFTVGWPTGRGEQIFAAGWLDETPPICGAELFTVGRVAEDGHQDFYTGWLCGEGQIPQPPSVVNCGTDLEAHGWYSNNGHDLAAIGWLCPEIDCGTDLWAHGWYSENGHDLAAIGWLCDDFIPPQPQPPFTPEPTFPPGSGRSRADMAAQIWEEDELAAMVILSFLHIRERH